jgi:dipeptidyl aminopeptidase/acylaminoacyl peptidase
MHLWRFDLASRQAAVVVAGGWVQGFDMAGDAVVTAADAMDHPVRVHAHRAGGAPRRLESFNDELLDTLRVGTAEEVTFKGALGEPVQMWLVYPPGFDRKKKYPLLHCIHGGPHTASGDTFHYRWNNQVFAAQGYVVACVNYHGSSSFGYAFLDSITHRWGELELQDIEAATDWALRQPWADRKRVFATGGSYGGYMVAWMNGHVAPGRYNAYICHAGCFDWTAMFSDDAYTWHARELGAWFWDDPAKVDSQSPHAYAKAMQTPTLVIHGALDYRVPDQQGLAYYNTLKARGVDARLVWYPDENHWILKPRNSKIWYGEFFDFLKRHEVRKTGGPKPTLRQAIAADPSPS